jgi:hypothetical protein
MRKTAGRLVRALPLALLVLLGAGEARTQGRNVL